jgi:hypothetical protein
MDVLTHTYVVRVWGNRGDPIGSDMAWSRDQISGVEIGSRAPGMARVYPHFFFVTKTRAVRGERSARSLPRKSILQSNPGGEWSCEKTCLKNPQTDTRQWALVHGLDSLEGQRQGRCNSETRKPTRAMAILLYKRCGYVISAQSSMIRHCRLASRGTPQLTSAAMACAKAKGHGGMGYKTIQRATGLMQHRATAPRSWKCCSVTKRVRSKSQAAGRALAAFGAVRIRSRLDRGLARRGKAC